MNPNSSPTPYITGADFVTLKDVRSIGQYASDDPNNPVADADVPTNPVVLFFLAQASGMLESAVLTSQRYAVSDLQSLTGVSQNYMKSILADIAMYRIMTRRPGANPPETVVRSYEEAMQALQALANGEQIFAFEEAEAAGVPSVYSLNAVDLYKDNFTSVRFRRVWGNRLEMRRLR